MESDKHRELIGQIGLWIRWKFPEAKDFIDDDSDGALGRPRPPSIAGYRPDAFVLGGAQRTTIVGEAKTANDLDSEHSRRQLEAYIAYLSTFSDGVLVVSTQWQARRTAMSLLKRLLRQASAMHVLAFTITDVDKFDMTTSD